MPPATRHTSSGRGTQSKLVAFAGLYVLITSTVGVILMKESKALGRLVFPPPTLKEGT